MVDAEEWWVVEFAVEFGLPAACVFVDPDVTVLQLFGLLLF